MSQTLKDIYIHNRLRKKYKNGEWYKISRNGKCPEKEYETNIIYNTYSNKFSCTAYLQPYEYQNRILSAKQCASERMAEIKYLIDNKLPYDDKHIYPIIIAYKLGYECAKLSKIQTIINQYINQFRKWYDELIENNKDIHNMFIRICGNLNKYPFEYYTIKQSDIYKYNKTRKNKSKNTKYIYPNWNSMNQSNPIILPEIQNNRNADINNNDYNLEKYIKSVSRKGSNRTYKKDKT